MALLLSGAIGLERELRRKDAGLRTHILVEVGAALFMLIRRPSTSWSPCSCPSRRRLPLAAAGTSTLLVRYPDGHGILRKVLNEATQRGFVIDDLATEPADGGKDGDGPPMVAVTMHVHGKRPVSELASALTELDLAEAVVAANPQPADE